MNLGILDDYLNCSGQLADWASLPGSINITTFQSPIPGPELADTLQSFDILIAMRERTRFDRKLLEALPRLKLLVTTGPRNAAIDMEACAERGITVCGTRSRSASTAETAWLHILTLVKRFECNRLHPSSDNWQSAMPGGLEGRTLGVIGLGRIGQRVASVAQGFGMHVLAWSQNLVAQTARDLGVEPCGKEDLFRRSDIVTLHLILSERTRHVVGPRELGLMQPHSYLVNTSRAGLVDESALLAALHSGAIAGAGLDVFDLEPLPADHPIRQAPRTVLTPHIGYVNEDTFRLYYTDALEDVRAWLGGSPLRETRIEL